MPEGLNDGEQIKVKCSTCKKYRTMDLELTRNRDGTIIAMFHSHCPNGEEDAYCMAQEKQVALPTGSDAAAELYNDIYATYCVAIPDLLIPQHDSGPIHVLGRKVLRSNIRCSKCRRKMLFASEKIRPEKYKHAIYRYGYECGSCLTTTKYTHCTYHCLQERVNELFGYKMIDHLLSFDTEPSPEPLDIAKHCKDALKTLRGG